MELSLSQQLVVASLVVGLLLLAVKLAANRGWIRVNRFAAGAGSARMLERVERYVLTPQHQLHLMRFDGQLVMIATHPRGIEVVKTAACELQHGAHS